MNLMGESAEVDLHDVRVTGSSGSLPSVNIEAQRLSAERPADIESKNIQKLEGEVIFVQNLFKTELKMDEIVVGYGRKGENMTCAFGVYRDSGLKWGSLIMGNPPRDADTKEFLSQTMTTSEISIFDHEFTHLLILSRSEEITNPEYPIDEILNEGLACTVEMASINRNSTEKIDMAAVAAHNRRLVNENADILLNPKARFDHDVAEDDNYLRSMLFMREHFYDGFARNDRGIKYIAGISFVLNVLGNRLDKWTILYDNPPTLEEVVNPDKYMERMGEAIDKYQVNETTPNLPLISSHHKQPEDSSSPTMKKSEPIKYSFIPQD